MKTSISNLLKSRITQAGLLLTLVAGVTASTAWSDRPECRVKQGGAWAGQLGGIQWTAIHAPLSDDGKRAVQRLQWITLNADFEGLLGAFGAQRLSEASGVMEMTGKDTAKYTLVFYAVADGTASTTAPVAGQIKAIMVMTGLWHYTGPDKAESQEVLAVYLPDGNPEHNVLPAPDATPFKVFTFGWHPQHRIPLL
jgi:hypothetical protein